MALCIEVISLAYIEEIGLFDIFTPHSQRQEILDAELKLKHDIATNLSPWSETTRIPYLSIVDKTKNLTFLLGFIILHISIIILSFMVIGTDSDTKSPNYSFE